MTQLDEIRARVAASRAAQGLPPVITDLAAIERAAAILQAATGAGRPDASAGGSGPLPERPAA